MVASDEFDIDVLELTISQLQEGYAQRRFTAETIARAHLARIERYEPTYNAFTSFNPAAIEDAKAIDARRAKGDWLGPLAGVPIVVKETVDVFGLPTTMGWAPLSSSAGGVDLMPERDAPVVARLRAAGAVILGKTNVPAFCWDGGGANSSWDGPTFNAVDRSIAPGGSSTGTATAIAASFAVVGLAAETGGSIQNPAAAQSLVSVKPTFGLVPNTGAAPLGGSTLDVIGPHARNAVDAAFLLDVLAGYTLEDPKTVASIGKLPVRGYAASLRPDALAGVRLGLYGVGWREQPLSLETEGLYDAVKTNLHACGATLIDDPFVGSGFSNLAQLHDAYDNRGMESMLYDMEHYLQRLGPSAAAHSFAGLKALVRQDPFAPDGILANYLQSQPSLRERLLEKPTAPPDLGGFIAARLRYLEIFEVVMERNDLSALAFPQTFSELPGVFNTATYPATTVSEINIAGLPAVTVPAGRYANGSPFSLIFVGRMWSEATLLNVARAYENAYPHRIIPQLIDKPIG